MFKSLSDQEIEALDQFVSLVFQCARYERPSTDWFAAGEAFVQQIKALNPTPLAWSVLDPTHRFIDVMAKETK